MHSGGKIGRNDPCPCGSGKKHKRCCLESNEASASVWHRLRSAESAVTLGALRYGLEEYGRDLLFEAWEEFNLGEDLDGEPAEYPEFETLFLPWFVFNWIPDPETERAVGALRPEVPLALDYLEAAGAELPEFEQRFIVEACGRAFSFHSVEGVDPGRRIELKDVFTGRRVEVMERTASREIEPGGVMFARVVSLDGASIMCGCAPLLMPPPVHLRLIETRDELAGKGIVLDEESLHGFDLALIEIYWSIHDELHNPRLPELRNTDGDRLEPTTLQFALHCTPAEAFARLEPLTLGRPEDADVTRGEDGELRTARFTWLKKGNEQHRDWDNTVMGSIAIEPGRLVAEVNSQRRAEAIRSQIDVLLGERSSFEGARVESLEAMLEEHDSRPETEDERLRREETDRINALPEAQAHLGQLAERHWESWVDESLPALAGQSPRQAARTVEGRERLEVLLRDFEWRAAGDEGSPFRPDVAALRRALGL